MRTLPDDNAFGQSYWPPRISTTSPRTTERTRGVRNTLVRSAWLRFIVT